MNVILKPFWINKVLNGPKEILYFLKIEIKKSSLVFLDSEKL